MTVSDNIVLAPAEHAKLDELRKKHPWIGQFKRVDNAQKQMFPGTSIKTDVANAKTDAASDLFTVRVPPKDPKYGLPRRKDL